MAELSLEMKHSSDAKQKKFKGGTFIQRAQGLGKGVPWGVWKISTKYEVIWSPFEWITTLLSGDVQCNLFY